MNSYQEGQILHFFQAISSLFLAIKCSVSITPVLPYEMLLTLTTFINIKKRKVRTTPLLSVHLNYYRTANPAFSTKSAALSVCSQGSSMSVRPKWP